MKQEADEKEVSLKENLSTCLLSMADCVLRLEAKFRGQERAKVVVTAARTESGGSAEPSPWPVAVTLDEDTQISAVAFAENIVSSLDQWADADRKDLISHV